jgi:hypothetical protein
MWVPPSNTSLYFIFFNGQDANGEDIFDGYQTEDLPTNAYSTIVINAVDNLVQFRVNDNNVALRFAADRVFDLSDFYVSDTDLYPPAKAAIKDHTITPISLLSSDLQIYKPQRFIRSDFFGVLNVPDDFSISFNILLNGKSVDWCSVLHFAGAEKDIFMPSVWLHADTTQLFIAFSGCDGDGIAETISTELQLGQWLPSKPKVRWCKLDTMIQLYIRAILAPVFVALHVCIFRILSILLLMR